jgi:glycosyltransferase involved in cell wall biosynthesis
MRTPPAVLFAIGGLGTGGSEGQLVELLVRTHGDVLQASLITFTDAAAERHAVRLRDAGVPHYTLPTLRGNSLFRAAAAAPYARRLIRQVRPDVIYAWLEETALYFAPFARLQGVPLMVARQNVCGARGERYPWGKAAIRKAERSASLVTANSTAVAVDARRRGIRPERIRTILNGHAPVEPLPMPDDGLVRLGCVAQFRREKGHMRLLEVLGRVSARSPWRLDLAGEGPFMRRVARQVILRGLEDRVRLLGHVKQVRKFWGDQHVALLLSDTEGSPNALIEAALAGRPMVGTATGGTPEVIGDEGGFVVALDDYDGAARAVEHLIDDPTLRLRLGEAAHRRAAHYFAMDRFVAGHISAIREVCG